MKWMITVLTLYLYVVAGQAQTLEEARKLYLEGQFQKALPAFEKAIESSAKNAKNASYNQWYGNCLLETGRLEESEKYLRFAASKSIQEAFHSLGKLYFLQYRFEESAEAYESYLELLKDNKKPDAKGIAHSQELLDLSKRAARMMSRCEAVQIIDSVVIDKDDLAAGYLLNEEMGSIRTMPELPGTILYENQLNNRRYYAKTDKNGKFKLCMQTKLMGNWSDEKLLELPIDTISDDNYPYVLSDGVTVYFASTGYGSIGGYDLFVTRYNMNSDTYLNPEQLGMPFNSLYNDYMLVVDESNGIGYFATDRFQQPDKITVYTYILNDEIQTLDEKNQTTLANRAKITSIRDTWKSGVDYGEMLAKMKAGAGNEKKSSDKEFEFVVNDNTIYYTIHDFKNESAKQLFVQSEKLRQSIDELERQLDDMRQDYVRGNKSKAQTILSYEAKLNELKEEYRATVIKVRNTEIRQIIQP
jgi:TolA-binding protein